MTCHDAEPLLHDALEGAPHATEAAALAAHLESCAPCRDLQADLAWIRQATGALDRPILPADGWQQLAGRLDAEHLLAPAASAAGSPWRGYAWMAFAATLLAGTGAAIVWRASDRVVPPAAIGAASIATAQPGVRGNARDPRAVEAIETELRLAAEHYEKAIVGLEAIVAGDRTQLDPAVAGVVERNLALIDQAIAESRTAMRGQPGNLQAQASLFDAYRRKVTLLQDLIALASDAQRSHDRDRS